RRIVRTRDDYPDFGSAVVGDKRSGIGTLYQSETGGYRDDSVLYGDQLVVHSFAVYPDRVDVCGAADGNGYLFVGRKLGFSRARRRLLEQGRYLEVEISVSSNNSEYVFSTRS